MAEAGEIVRCHGSEADPEEHLGPPHPAEKGYLLPHEDPYPDDMYDDLLRGDHEAYAERHRQVQAELGIPEECSATDVTARASVDPASLGPHTPMTGHGVLAVTELGRRVGAPQRVLSI